MSRGFLIGMGIVVGVVVALPLLAMRCKRVQEEEAAAAGQKANKEGPRRVTNPPPPDRGGFVIKSSDGAEVKHFWSAEACWAEWDGSYSLMWEAQTEKGMKPQNQNGCWAGTKRAPRTAPAAESLPEYRRRREREAR